MLALLLRVVGKLFLYAGSETATYTPSNANSVSATDAFPFDITYTNASWSSNQVRLTSSGTITFSAGSSYTNITSIDSIEIVFTSAGYAAAGTANNSYTTSLSSLTTTITKGATGSTSVTWSSGAAVRIKTASTTSFTVHYTTTAAATPTLDIDVSKTLEYVGHDFELEATASNYTPSSWTWTSSTNGVVSIDSDDGYAVITPEAAGTTTITVSAPNGTTSMTKTCAVTVTSASGADTNNPFTVDDAILAAKYYGTTTSSSSYYMEGVVSSLYNDKYPMLNGTSLTNDDLEVYKDCSSSVYVGDTIRVYGPLFYYNSIQPEFTSASTVTLIKVPVDSVSASISVPVPTSITDGDLSDYLSVTVNGTNSRSATNTGWKVTASSNTSVISISGADGKTFTSSSSVGTTTLTIASTDDTTKTTTLEVTLLDASTPVLQSVTVGGTPSKATQYVGKTFDWTGLTFTPVYSPVKDPVESITGANITWNALVAGQNPTGTYTGDDDVSVTVTVTSVSVEADGIYSVHVSGDMSTKSYDEDASWDYPGLVVKVTYKSDHETQVNPSSDVTWTASSTPKQLGVGTGKSVNVTATVGGVSSAAYTVSGITVTEHVAAVYGLYSGLLTEGDYVITHNSSVALTNELASNTNYIGYTDVSGDVSESKITDPDSSIVWHVAASGDYWTIYNAAETVYAASTGAKNKGQVLTSPVAAADTDKTLWSVTSTSSSTSYDFVNKQNTANSVNATLRYNSGYGFATYATGTGQALSLYKLGYTVKTLSSITIDTEPDKTTYNEGETLDLTGLVVLANWSDSTSIELTSSDYTVTPSVSTALTTSDNEVIISYTYNEVEKTDSFSITVSSVPLSERDKILDSDSLNLNGTSYAANNGDHKVDGVNFTTTAVMLSGGTMQFQKTNGNILNSGALFDGTSSAIKSVTVFMNSENADEIIVSESSDKSSYSAVSVSGSYSTTGVNVYNFSSNMSYFKVSASSTTFAKIDRIVVELVDGASTSLTRARNAAQAILDNLDGLCGTGGSGVVTQSQWNTLVSAVNTALASDSTAKDILKNAVRLEIHDLSQSNLKIENAMYHYDACIEKFGFSGDSSITDVSASAKVTPISTLAESGNAAATIVIISMIGLTAIGGYFFLRKRKEN